jgi:hypothetical protein
MKTFIAILLVLSGLSHLSSAQSWEKINGVSPYVNAILIPDNTGKVIVCSDSIQTDILGQTIEFPPYGVFQTGYQESNDFSKTFGEVKLKDYSVFDILISQQNPQNWFASVRRLIEGGIAKSTNAGLTWDTDNLKCQSSSQIIKFAQSKLSNVIHGAELNSSKGYKYTDDEFANCNTIDTFVIQARDIQISPYDQNTIYLAGDRSLKHFYISSDNGKTWTGDESGLENKRILCIQPSRWNKAVLYVGVDSLDSDRMSHGKGIYQSVDSGRTWKLIAAHGKRVFSISQHPINDKYMAAACDSGTVLFSGSWGYGWENFSDGIPNEASVRTVIITPWEAQNGAVVLAGTYGNGLYKSKSIVTTVDDQKSSSLQILRVSPLPFLESVSIDFANEIGNSVRIAIYDLQGRILEEKNLDNISGVSSYKWEPVNLNSGMYIIELSNGINKVYHKLIK